MMTIREYARPATLEEAWQLNQKKPNRVLGGMLWLKMEKIDVGTAIDLRSMSQGRGSYSLKFVRYEEVPQINQAKIIEDAKKADEE